LGWDPAICALRGNIYIYNNRKFGGKIRKILRHETAIRGVKNEKYVV